MLVVPQTILGVDFSGAHLAGEKIWIAHSEVTGGVLRIQSLQRACELPGGAIEREAALRVTREYISSFKNALCGFDFPFSLALESFPEAERADFNWREWLAALPEYSDAEEFKAAFPDAARATDLESKTPFSPLNLRLFRQTFHGLRDVVLPLVESGALALPFDELPFDEVEAESQKLRLLEICPASLLKKQKLYLSYKGRSPLQRENRETILQQTQERTRVKMSEEISRRIFKDTEGDALDAVLAAVCTFRALQNPVNFQARNEREKFEGRVYF